MLAKENAAKELEAQGVCGLKKKKRNGHCRLVKKDYGLSIFIDELSVFC
ncbi:peroxiredoxin [Citrobacter telavivensis]|uniref:Peroxiredoxin n=1 Tax=Citrobacter telavivensis TaxID=2653932 RepID=A0A6L5E5D7_9ENTR|nr:peroxiredoxin [Citrobacter telavivensis]QFS72796.1 peroxiredoxin [Citrobacter telavivensis]